MAPNAPESLPLRSDHVNYLIWRYLQERGYSHAAVQLSRDWNKDPASLPFADDVNPHDLVSVIQEGIMYDDLAAKIESRDKKYQFIVDKKRKAPHSTLDSLSNFNDSLHNRKRQKLDHAINDRPRSHNVVAAAAAQTDSDGMEIEKNGSPMEVDLVDTDMKTEESPVLVSTLSAGESTGIQQPPVAKTVALLRVPGADILDLSWSPNDDPELFATGGSVWRSWKLGSRLSSHDEDANEPQYTHHAPSDGVFSVSASARATNRGIQASAFADDEGSVILLDVDGQEPRRVLTKHHGTATLLRWDLNDNRLLVVSQKASSNEISLWKAEDSTCLAFVDTSQVVEDAAWAHDDQFILCGDGFLLLHRLPPAENNNHTLDQGNPIKSISSSTMWAFVKYDPYTRKAACVAPDEGQVALLGIDDFAFQSKASHDGQITAIEWGESTEDSRAWEERKMRLLISSSTEGTIKIWNTHTSLECLFSLNISSQVPAMTLGAHKDYIAAAGDGQISVWKIHWPAVVHEPPRVEEITAWHAQREGKHAIDSRIGWPVDEAPFHKVSWQSHHNLLAYSAGNEIHVIQIP